MTRFTMLSAVAVAALVCTAWSQSGGQDAPPPPPAPSPGPRGPLPTYEEETSSAREYWEYRVLTAYAIDVTAGEPAAEHPGQNLERGLNTLGGDGWELIAIDAGSSPQTKAGNAAAARYIFKRSASSGEPRVVPFFPPPAVD